MGSPEESSGSGAGKSPNPKATAAPLAAAATPTPTPPPATPASPVMMPYPDCGAGAGAGANYASGAAASTPFFPHVAWSGQPMFSPLYYANPSMSLSTGTPNLNQESSEGPPSDGKDQGSPNKLKKATTTGDGGKAISGSAEEDATQSGETGSDGSSATEDDGTDPQDSSADKKRALSDAFAEREAAQGRVQYSSATSESSHSGRVPKLPVSAPGRATLPGPATNLNIGMDYWNDSHAGAGPVKPGPNAVNIAPLMPGREAVMPERQWMQVAERELKKEKRKQSNRESARRSRLRKQQECEELARKVAELTSENTILKVEVEQLTKRSEELRAENASLMARHPDLLTEEEQVSLHGHVAVSASEGDSDSDPSTMLTVGEGSRYVHQSPVGSTTRNVQDASS